MSDPNPTNPVSRANCWLAWVLAASVGCCLLIISAYILIGDNSESAFNRTGWSTLPEFVNLEYGDDSMGPMGRAFLRTQSRDDGDIYGIFFDEGRKFQYPPTSLLIFHVLPEWWLSPEYFKTGEFSVNLAGPPLWITRAASQFAVLLTIVASIAILEIGIRRLRAGREESMASRLTRIGIATCLGLTFYPVMKAHHLGQVQVFLNALTAIGVLAHLLGWQVRSGFCLGLCCLVKPQYGVLVIWAVLRHHWRVLSGFFMAAVPLGLISLAVFGWANHMRYIEVIRQISQTGETYWANQCFNGFANRLLSNGDPTGFSELGFPPYHPWVHTGTIITSLLILVIALWSRRSLAAKNPTLDLGVVIVASTLASPVAWEHHYGAFLPLFALALPTCLQAGLPSRILGVVLGLSFLAMGVALLAPDSFFSVKWRGPAASHLYFGAVLFFGLLIYLRRRLPSLSKSETTILS